MNQPTKNNYGPSRIVKTLGWIVILLFILASGYLFFEMWKINIFSDQILVIVTAALLIFLVLMVWGCIFSGPHKIVRAICIILCLALTAGIVTGGYYINQTNEVFNIIGGNDGGSSEDDNSEIYNEADLLSSKMAVTVTTYAMKETGFTTPADLNGKTLGVVTQLDEKGTEGALEQLQKNGAVVETVEYPDQYTLTDALYDDEVDAIVLPEQYHGDLLDAANDINKYNALTTFTNVIDQYIYYEDIPEELHNPADPVEDITKDPFTVLISGSDSYGTLNGKTRSDVNMLVSVNPQTHQVLMVSVPRDAYVTFSCKKNPSACEAVAGQKDKLTHSGLFGVGCTESILEDLMDVEINYTVRVNFSSLINVVDAIGGIDVFVEEGQAVDQFYSNGTPGVQEGWNHLEGERALAFARERHAYIDGDNQRIKNQQTVMKAILKAMMSPSMIVNYAKFMRALSTAFSTNMPGSQIRELIKLEISQFPDWNIQSYALVGASAYSYSAYAGMDLSMSMLSASQIQTAGRLIDEVYEGQVPEVPQDEMPGDFDTADPSGIKPDQGSEYSDEYYGTAEDPGAYTPQQPVYQDPVYQDPGFDTPVYDPSVPSEDEPAVDLVQPEDPYTEPDTDSSLNAVSETRD